MAVPQRGPGPCSRRGGSRCRSPAPGSRSACGARSRSIVPHPRRPCPAHRRLQATWWSAAALCSSCCQTRETLTGAPAVHLGGFLLCFLNPIGRESARLCPAGGRCWVQAPPPPAALPALDLCHGTTAGVWRLTPSRYRPRTRRYRPRACTPAEGVCMPPPRCPAAASGAPRRIWRRCPTCKPGGGLPPRLSVPGTCACRQSGLLGTSAARCPENP